MLIPGGRRSHLTDAVRERCSLESITQPTWHSMGGLELCRVFLFLGVWKATEITCRSSHNIPASPFTPIWRPSYFSIYGSTFLHHGVKAWRHALVLPVRRAWRSWGPGTAIIGGVGHGSGERAGDWGGLRGAEEFVCQSVCGHWGGEEIRNEDEARDVSNLVSIITLLSSYPIISACKRLMIYERIEPKLQVHQNDTDLKFLQT